MSRLERIRARRTHTRRRMVAGAAVATGLLLFPATTAFGIPTTATWTATVDALRVARDRYPVVLAPADVTAVNVVGPGMGLRPANGRG